MIEVFVHFLSFEVLNYHPFVPWAILIIWGILLASAFHSIRNLSIGRHGRVTWLLIVFAIPFLGLVVYSSRCLVKGDWTFLKPLLQSKSDAVKSVTQSAKAGKAS